MSKRMLWGVLLVSAVWLGACDKRPDPATPQVNVGASGAAQSSSTAPETSVPAADSVIKSGTAASPASASGDRTNTALTRAQESNAMPMAGQANDHSAPLAPAKAASAR